jgi:hypothetical protein
MKYELFEVVLLAREIPEHGLTAGHLGTVVETYPATDGLEVEFVDDEGETIAVLTLEDNDVRKFTAASPKRR